MMYMLTVVVVEIESRETKGGTQRARDKAATAHSIFQPERNLWASRETLWMMKRKIRLLHSVSALRVRSVAAAATAAATTAKRADLECLVLRHHHRQYLEDVFRHRVVVDANQGFWFGVDFQPLVET